MHQFFLLFFQSKGLVKKKPEDIPPTFCFVGGKRVGVGGYYHIKANATPSNKNTENTIIRKREKKEPVREMACDKYTEPARGKLLEVFTLHLLHYLSLLFPSIIPKKKNPLMVL